MYNYVHAVSSFTISLSFPNASVLYTYFPCMYFVYTDSVILCMESEDNQMWQCAQFCTCTCTIMCMHVFSLFHSMHMTHCVSEHATAEADALQENGGGREGSVLPPPSPSHSNLPLPSLLSCQCCHSSKHFTEHHRKVFPWSVPPRATEPP